MTEPQSLPQGAPRPPFGTNLRRHAPRAFALVLVCLALVLITYDAGLRLVVDALSAGQQPLLAAVPAVALSVLLGLVLLYLFFTVLARSSLHHRKIGAHWRGWVALALALALAGLGLLLTATTFLLVSGLPFYALAAGAVLACGWQMLRGEL